MNKTIDAVLTRGLGLASRTVAAQKPLLEPFAPGFGACFSGTLNLQLSFPLFIKHPDVRTPPLLWKAGYPKETFRLTRIALHLTRKGNTEELHSWIYEAGFSPYNGDPQYYEIVAPYIETAGLEGIRVRLLRPPQSIQVWVL